MIQKMRIDKWLWCVRIFKSRTKATDACKSGRVKIGEVSVKASYMVTRDEIIHLKKGGYNLTYQVVDILKSRGSAVLAEPCYINLTPKEELLKFKDWFVGKGAPERREKGAGRPTKRDRRELETYKNDKYE